MEREPIRIRLTPREPLHEVSNPRVAFWRAVHQGDMEDRDIGFNEAKLCREFGKELREVLLSHLAEPLRSVEDNMLRDQFLYIERFLHESLKNINPKKSWEQAQAIDAFTRLIDQRQRMFREIPGLQRMQDRLAAAGNVVFTTRIASYSSLNLELSIGSLKSVAEIFDNDFESFRVFFDDLRLKTDPV